jgi:SAM-dependent methyltransferase
MPVVVIANPGPPDIAAYFLDALAKYFDRIFAVDDAAEAAVAGLPCAKPIEPLSALSEADGEVVWFSSHDVWADDTLLAMLAEARTLGHAAYVNRLQLGYSPLISRDVELGRRFARHRDPIGFLAHRSKSQPDSDIYLSTTTFDRRPYYLRTDEPVGLTALRDMIEQGTDQRVLTTDTHKTTFQVLNQKHMLRMLSRIETFIDLEGKRVLEIGASPKNPAIGDYLTREKGCRYTGLNIAPFEYDSRPDMEMVCSDIHAVDFEPGSFDLVFSIAVWEHIPNPLPLFDQIAGWLRPSGIHYGIFQNWTSSIGHHIFAPRFPQHFVPDWAQLLYPTEETMSAALERHGAPENVARKIAAFTHSSSEINRVASRDFVRTIMGGPLEVLYLDGRTRGKIDPRATALAEQVPNRTDEEMTCMGLEFALRKSEFDIRAWAQ